MRSARPAIESNGGLRATGTLTSTWGNFRMHAGQRGQRLAASRA